MRLMTLLTAAVLAAGCAADKPRIAAAPKPAAPACDPPPSTLVVKDTQVGTGRVVGFRSAVLVGYTGWLYDPKAPDCKGVQFDSSIGRATPFGFMVGAGRVIKGWDQGLLGMRENGKRTLIIPPHMGYGDRGAGDRIPPGSTLLFEIELHQITWQPEGGAAPSSAPSAPAPSAPRKPPQ